MALTVAGAAWRLGPYGEGTGRTVASERPAAQAPASRLETARTAPSSAPTAARELAEPGLDVTSAVPEPAAVVASTLAAADSIAWVPAVARTWVNVRSDASRGGEVIGVIKPSSRAMLGTNRAGWVQVRSPDAVGWVDPRLFAADSTRPRGE
jgi:hypothetical protein